MQLHPKGAGPGSSFPSSSWMILVSRGSVGSLCTVHSAFSGSAWYVLFILMWWIQGATPATLTAVGVVRTVNGPSSVGPRSHVSSPWPTPDPRAQICESVPHGGDLSCTNLATWFITLPSCSICCEISSPLTWGKFVDTCFIMGGASHTQFHMEKSHGTVGSSWIWAEPSETSPPRSSQSLWSSWRVSL